MLADGAQRLLATSKAKLSPLEQSLAKAMFPTLPLCRPPAGGDAAALGFKAFREFAVAAAQSGRDGLSCTALDRMGRAVGAAGEAIAAGAIEPGRAAALLEYVLPRIHAVASAWLALSGQSGLGADEVEALDSTARGLQLMEPFLDEHLRALRGDAALRLPERVEIAMAVSRAVDLGFSSATLPLPAAPPVAV